MCPIRQAVHGPKGFEAHRWKPLRSIGREKQRPTGDRLMFEVSMPTRITANTISKYIRGITTVSDIPVEDPSVLPSLRRGVSVVPKDATAAR